jgi:hypothetical protein
MACAAPAVNVYTEAARDDFQVLNAPVASVPPHSREDLLGIGHDNMVPNTAPRNNAVRLTKPTTLSAKSMGAYHSSDVVRIADFIPQSDRIGSRQAQ